jgi:hypothetical protein
MTFRELGVNNMLTQKRKLDVNYRRHDPMANKGHRNRSPRSVGRQRPTSEIHALAMQALRHFALYGDSIFLSNLVASISTPAARKSLIKWCEQYGGLSWKPALGRFRGGIPKNGVALAEAEKEPFRKSTIAVRDPVIGIDVSVLWTIVDPLGRQCRVCSAPSMIGEDTCFSHHFK